MGKPTSGGAGGSGGRQRTVADQPIEYKSFNGVKDEEKFLNDSYDQLTLSKEQGDELTYYQANGFYAINNYLRTGNPEEDETTGRKPDDNLINVIDGTFRPLADNLILNKSIGNFDNIRERIENGSLIGKTITDKAYTSTSTSKALFDDYTIQFNIRVPKGTRVSIPSRKGDFSHENEIIIHRNAKYRILGSRTEIIDGQKVLLVDSEYVGYGD